jgi:hypothetical protein
VTVLEGKVTGSWLVSTAPPSFRDRPLRSLRSARMSENQLQLIKRYAGHRLYNTATAA